MSDDVAKAAPWNRPVTRHQAMTSAMCVVSVCQGQERQSKQKAGLTHKEDMLFEEKHFDKELNNTCVFVDIPCVHFMPAPFVIRGH